MLAAYHRGRVREPFEGSRDKLSAMADGKKKRQLKTFPGLIASRFQHPQDAAATEALAVIPGLDLVVSKVM